MTVISLPLSVELKVVDDDELYRWCFAHGSELPGPVPGAHSVQSACSHCVDVTTRTKEPVSGIARSTCVGVPTVMLVTYWTEKKFSIGAHMLGVLSCTFGVDLAGFDFSAGSECIADGAPATSTTSTSKRSVAPPGMSAPAPRSP